MSAKKKEEKKIEIERTYNIPLRKGFQKAPKYKRAKKAVSAVRVFLKRHMKSDNIKIGRYLNEEIWKFGIKNPPHHIKVSVTKDSEGLVFAELAVAPKTEEKKEGGKEKGKLEEKEEISKKEKIAEEEIAEEKISGKEKLTEEEIAKEKLTEEKISKKKTARKKKKLAEESSEKPEERMAEEEIGGKLEEKEEEKEEIAEKEIAK